MKTIYRCVECGAEDSDRTSTPPSVLTCTNSKCRSGADPKLWKERFGMFPVDAKGFFPWGEPAPKGVVA
jgi:hypothetical protein